MASAGGNAPADTAACVAIRHCNPWIQGIHGAAFLRPLVDGVRRRLTSSDGKKAPESGAR